MTIITVAGRRLLIHDRTEWQDPRYPVTGPKPSPELVHHAVIHWPGAADSWVPDTDVAAHLRWAHALYLLDPNRGYSYGYGFVCGPNPIDWDADLIITDIWQVRGTDIRIASNDGDNGQYGRYRNPNFNGRSISLQIMASTNHPATDDQIEQARYWVAAMDQVYSETLEVIPHRTSDATACPGDHLASKVPYIATRPDIPPPPDPIPSTSEEEHMIPAVAKTTGPHLVQFTFRGPVYTMGHTADHDVTPEEAFGRGAGKAFDVVGQKVVSYADRSNQGSWGAVKATVTEAAARALLAR